MKTPRFNVVAISAAILFISSIATPASTALENAKVKRLVRSDRYSHIPAKAAAAVAIPEGYHEGLFYDGRLLWLANGQRGKIWKIDPASGSVTGTLEGVSTFTEAVTAGPDGTLLVTDWDERKLFKARIEGEKIVPEAEISFGKAHPTGVAWDGENIFVITWTRGMGTKFNILRLDGRLNMIGKAKITVIQEPDQLTWDGKYLWVTSWHGKRVYKVDPRSWEVLGEFRSPIRDTTGIAWDGKYFWLTGTKENLYRMETGDGK